MYDMTYAEAIEKAEALKSLKQTIVYLRDEKDFPWQKVTEIEVGGTYRFSGPVGIYLKVEEQGLTFKLSFDFESREANGKGASLFDREKIQNLALKLSPYMRRELAKLFREKVLPDLTSRTREIQEALNAQWDSENCVRGIIAFADEQSKVKSE